MSLRTAFVGLVAVMLVGFVSAVLAAEAKTVTVTGDVKAMPAGNEMKAAAMVEVERKVGDKVEKMAYRVTDDDQGKKLAKEADGKKAEVKGTVEEKDKALWLTVTEFKIVE